VDRKRDAADKRGRGARKKSLSAVAITGERGKKEKKEKVIYRRWSRIG